jgi:hypothetical protein
MKKIVSDLVMRIEGYDEKNGFEVISVTLCPDGTYTVQVRILGEEK